MYNYHENVKDDIKQAIYDNYTVEEIAEKLNDREEFAEKLRDDLWRDDAVTGNASGSYTFNAYQAEENLAHNYELLKEACDEFGESLGTAVEQGAEFCDVTIRCYLLGSEIDNALDEIEAEIEAEIAKIRENSRKSGGITTKSLSRRLKGAR